jgi:hypothetical protein
MKAIFRAGAPVRIDPDTDESRRHVLGGGVVMAFLAAVVAVVGGLPASASADTQFTVTRNDDPNPNGCTSTDCSLREASLAANFTDGSDQINIPPGTYTFTLPGNLGGDLDLNEQVTLQNTGLGSQPDPVVIDGNGDVLNDRTLDVSASVTLNHITVTGGVAAPGTEDVARGGGIRVRPGGGLLMRGGRITHNNATPTGKIGEGGGLYAEGPATLLDTVVMENDAWYGGGVFATGTGDVTITRTAVRYNEATFGGGILAQGGADVAVTESRVGRNNASGGAGGGVLVKGGAEAHLFNSNIDNNMAGQDGGGGVHADGGTVIVDNSTVAANHSPGGGGISVAGAAGSGITLRNSLVANNRDPNLAFTDCRDANPQSKIVSEGYNLVSDQAAGCRIPPAAGDQLGGGAQAGDPPPILALLTTEAFYGGTNTFVLMHALEPQSPAVDTGAPDSICSETDLRGVPRPAGGECDTGAYELRRCGGAIVNRVGTANGDSSKQPFMAPTAVGDDGFLGFDGDDRLRGGVGNDGLCGGDEDDRLKGEEGNDTLSGGPGRDVCIGGPGKDKATGCETTRSIP